MCRTSCARRSRKSGGSPSLHEQAALTNAPLRPASSTRSAAVDVSRRERPQLLARREGRNPPAPADLDHEVAEALELFARCARKMTVAQVLDAGVIVSVDRDALRQIPLNLLDNAVKYGPPGQTIGVGCEVAGDRVRIFVRTKALAFA